MFFTGALVLGTALTTGTKVYFDVKKKRDNAWLLESFKAQKEAHLKLAKTEIAPLDDKTDIDQIEKRIDQFLTVSLAALGLAIGGIFVFPPLTLLSLAGFLYATASFFVDAYKSIVDERKLKISVVDAVLFTGIIITGSLVAGTLMCSLIWLAQKLLIKTEDRSRKSLVNVFGQQPRSVWIVKDDLEVELPFEQLQAGDTIVVNAGEVIPADGTIISGTASVNQHTLTGESQPVEKALGDPVFATTVVLSGRLYIEVEKAGTDSVAAQIGEVLLQTADFRETTKAHWVELVDKMAPAPRSPPGPWPCPSWA